MGNAMRFAGIAGVLAVAAGGCALAYHFSDTVKNQAKLAFSSPEDYFAWVMEKNTADAAEAAAAGWQTAAERAAQMTAQDAALTYQPSDAAKQKLLDELDKEQGQTDAQTELISRVSSVNVQAAASRSGGMMQERFAFGINGETAATADFAFSPAELTAYGRIPELTARWLKIPLGELDNAEKLQKLEGFAENPLNYLSAQEAAALVQGFGDVIKDNLHNITEEKHSSVQIADVTADYTALTAELSADEMQTLCSAVLDYTQNDAVLRGLVIEKLALLTDAEYDDAFAQARDSLAEGISGTLTLYVDGAGTIRAVRGADSDGCSGFLGIAKDGTRIGIESSAAKDGRSGAMTANLTQNGEAYDGTVQITGSGDDTQISETLTLSGLEIVNAEQGYLRGTVTVAVEGKDPCTVTLSSDGTSQMAEMAVVYEGTDCGTLSVTFRSAAEPLEAPDTANAFVLNPDADGAQLLEYVSPEEISAFVESALTKLGVDADKAQQIGDSAARYAELAAATKAAKSVFE